VTEGALLATLSIPNEDVMHEFGIRLAAVLSPGDLVLLTGPLGAGKTTLTRGVGEGLGVIGTVASPTFVIARAHKRQNSDAPLVHVDAYRLGSPAEFDDLDIDFENSIVLVEWGRGFADELTDSWLDIEIERDHTGATEVRTVTITGFGERFNSDASRQQYAALAGGLA
jgi:tRNA threonylcarbamoyladenosine biosynthesis protein TsaE